MIKIGGWVPFITTLHIKLSKMIMCRDSTLEDYSNTHSLSACVGNKKKQKIRIHHMRIWYWISIFRHSPHAYATTHVTHQSFYTTCMPSHLVNCDTSLFKIIIAQQQLVSEYAFSPCVFFTFSKKGTHPYMKCVFEWVKRTPFSYMVMIPGTELFLAFSSKVGA